MKEQNDLLLTREETIIAVCGECPFEGEFTDEQCHACQRQLDGVAKAQLSKDKTKLAGLMDKVVALERERDGEVWYWSGDGNDHPESLCCPILIEPEDMLKLLGQ